MVLVERVLQVGGSVNQPPTGTGMLLTLFVAMAAAGAWLLAYAIRRVVRLVRGSVLFRAPLVVEQDLEFEEAGAVVMHAEAPLSKTVLRGNRYAPPPAFRGLEYEIRHAQGGPAVPLRGTLGTGTVSGVHKTRVPLKSFTVDHPGAYVLSVRNLTPTADTPLYAFVFSRPYGIAMPLYILTIVVGGMLFIGGTVLGVLRLSGAL